MRSYTIDSNVATSEQTPATITAARARLVPVPPDTEAVTIVAVMTRGTRPRTLTQLNQSMAGTRQLCDEGYTEDQMISQMLQRDKNKIEPSAEIKSSSLIMM